MAWLCHELGSRFHAKAFAWGISFLLGFEIVYIVLQALRGEASHYNVGTPLAAFLYVLMAVAAALVTIWTAYVGYLFCVFKFPQLSQTYLWGICIGIFIFVVFSFEGFAMGSRMAHTVGAPDGGAGYFFLNWSREFGDLRISHFLGMHALQVLPILGYYVFKTRWQVLLFGLGYFAVTSAIFLITLMGRAVL